MVCEVAVVPPPSPGSKRECNRLAVVRGESRLVHDQGRCCRTWVSDISQDFFAEREDRALHGYARYRLLTQDNSATAWSCTAVYVPGMARCTPDGTMLGGAGYKTATSGRRG
jgi:hypothetical protein